MSDFAQNQAICTLQRLNPAHLHALESDWLPPLCKPSPVSLILPCHAPDLDGPALEPLCLQLAAAPWIHQVLIPVNGLPPDLLPQTRARFRQLLPLPHLLLPTDSPELGSLLSDAAGIPRSELPSGKGLNVWAALGWLRAHNTQGIFALQDCDVLSFQSASLARLCFALNEPSFGFDFAKMYYSRATDRLYGRVSRLFLSPLLHALTHVAGHLPLLHFLHAFRYPLAGECALRASLAFQLPLHPGWDLEIGMLALLFRHLEPARICQVDGGSGYDHKHQPAAEKLPAMCARIGLNLLHHLRLEGCPIDSPFLHSLALALQRESQEALRRSSILARINGLPFDPAQESANAADFTQTFLAHATPFPGNLPPALPPWDSIQKRAPHLLHRFRSLHPEPASLPL